MTGFCRSRSPAVEGHEDGTGWGDVCSGGRQGVREKGRAQSYAYRVRAALHSMMVGGAGPRTWGPRGPQQDEVEGDGGMG